MQVPVVMPQLGLTMEEGTVAEWLKKPGDEVKKNDFIFVVSTDKADMEVESLDEGRLAKIVVEAGRTVPVGEVVAYLEKEGTEYAAGESRSSDLAVDPKVPETRIQNPIPTTDSPNQPKVPVNVGPPDNHQRQPLASPRARRLAKELGIELSSLKSDGKSARLVEQDVRNAAQKLSNKATTGDSSRRRIIAQKMTESVQTIPHFSVSAELDVQALMNLYAEINAQGRQSAGGMKITVTDLLLKALARALEAVPEANATWADGALEPRSTVDLGIAIATERSVVAPVIRNADQLSLAEVVTKRSDLIERSRGNRLSVSDIEGGVGTLSNLGMFGIDDFQGIISPGQTFILAIGRIKERPWVEKTLTVRPTMRLNLAMDHRVVDGVTAARLLTKIGELISTPFNIIANLSELFPNRVG